MLRRRTASVTLVLVAALLVVASACQPPSIPIGARAVGPGVQAYAGSCSGAPVDIRLLETDVPKPTTTRGLWSTAPGGTSVTGSSRAGATTPPGSWWTPGDDVWAGRIAAGQQSVVIPVVLDPTRTYTLMAEGGEDDPYFEPYTFVPADLTADGVTSYGPWNGIESSEQFAETADSACDAAAGGPLPWIFGVGMVVAFLALAGFGFAVAKLINALFPPKLPPKPWE